MAGKTMKTPGAPAAADNRKTLAPTGGGQSGMAMAVTDDASSQDVYAAGMRARRAGSAADNDSALGRKGVKGRSATNASAQFRITATRSPLNEGPYPGTLAGGKILPAVMGQKQNFDADAAFSQSR